MLAAASDLPRITLWVIALLAMIATPIWLGVSAVAGNAERIGESVRALATEGFPPPPAWLERVPVVGSRLVGKWQTYTGNPEAVVAQLKPHAQDVAGWIASKAGGAGTTIVQLLVVVPATIWLYSSGAVGRGTLLLVISVVALTLDNVLRPILIKKGADLPLVLILSGVIGGVIAFGVIGLFIGPVLLAVAWTLLVAWVGDIDGSPAVPERRENP